jgi:DNA topoisomerase-1
MYWNTLEHNGPYFFSYSCDRENSVLKYNNCMLDISEEESLFVLLYSRYIDKYPFDHIFHKNFWQSWSRISNREIDFRLLDFRFIKKKFVYSSLPRNVPEKYKYCYVDDKKRDVVNFALEPPGIFLGRGDHPCIGMIKRQLRPEQVIVNTSNTSSFPSPNIGGKWKKIINNNKVNWLACWVHPVTLKIIYMYQARHTENRMELNRTKFDNARLLKQQIHYIRKEYKKMMRSKNEKHKQTGIVIYFLDHHLLRIGTRKDANMNTFGISTIQKRHVSFLTKNTICLEFLGKDSIVYKKNIKLPSNIYSSILYYYNNNDSSYIFDKTRSSIINLCLKKILPYLSAKTFRTFHSSVLFEECLLYHEKKNGLKKKNN